MNALLKTLGRLFAPVVYLLTLPLRLWFWIIVLLTLGVGLWGWRQFGQRESPPVVPATLQAAVEAASSRLPPALPRPQRALRPTLVLPLVDDRELLVTQGIRQALTRDGGYRPVDKGTGQQVLDELFELAGVPRQPVTDGEIALQIAEAAGAEVVVLGRVERLELQAQHAEVAFSLQVFETGSQTPLLADTFTSAPPPGLRNATSALPWAWALGVLAVAVLWPLLTIPVMARVVRRESNSTTLVTIVVISAVPVVVAWPLFFGTAIVAWRVITFALALLLVAFWTALVMSWVAAREEIT